MLTDDQITAGAARLDTDGALTAGDQCDLLSMLRVRLGVRAYAYADIPWRLASARTPVAERLAGALLILKEMNYDSTQITGAKTSVRSSTPEERALVLDYTFSLLYTADAGAEASADGVGVGSVSIPTKVCW